MGSPLATRGFSSLVAMQQVAEAFLETIHLTVNTNMESTEQEKDKQNPATAERQDNMAAASEFWILSGLNFNFSKFEMKFFVLLADTRWIDTLARPKPIPVGFIEDR